MSTGKIVAGVAVVAAVGLAGYGAVELAGGISGLFNSIASPEARFAAKCVGTALATAVCTIGLFIAGAEIHKDQEIGVIAYALGYAVVGFILGTVGGWNLTEKILPPLADQNKPAISAPAAKPTTASKMETAAPSFKIF